MVTKTFAFTRKYYIMCYIIYANKKEWMIILYITKQQKNWKLVCSKSRFALYVRLTLIVISDYI